MQEPAIKNIMMIVRTNKIECISGHNEILGFCTYLVDTFVYFA